MEEQLEVYDLQGEFLGVENRKKYYADIKDEFHRTGNISKKVKSIRLLLMNSAGRIYLQKRSKLKTENAGRYDKTIGGHVCAGDSFTMTVIRECAEELGFPATVLDSEEFEKAVKVTNLSIIGVCKKIDYLPNFVSERMLNNKQIMLQPYITSNYIGYYDGAIRFVDGESSGIEVFSLEELQQDIADHPDKFTEDSKFMIQTYAHLLVPL